MNRQTKITGNLSFLFLETRLERKLHMHAQKLWGKTGCFSGNYPLFWDRKPQNIRLQLLKNSHILRSKEIFFSRFHAHLGHFCTSLFHHLFNKSSGKGDFLPVNIYYNTTCEILQAKKRIFFRFYFNQLILCIFYYVNQCIFGLMSYVLSTRSGVNKNTHG